MMPHPIHEAAKGESYSQWGEDRLVLEFFGGRTDGFFLEAGAFHPVQLSQTYLLERCGWHGVLVEPVPDQVAEFSTKRPNSILIQKAIGAPEQSGQELTFVVPDGEATLARLLGNNEQPAPGDRVLRVSITTLTEVLTAAKAAKLDYLSLDLEGFELAALRGLDFTRWRPGLIMIEDRIEDLRQHRFLKEQGYRLVYRIGVNNWYVPVETEFPKCTPLVRIKLFRKLYLSMPLRKLRSFLRRFKK